MKKMMFVGIAIACGFIINDAVFVLRQTDQCIILRFGEAMRTIQAPGLHFKIPFIEDVLRFDRRMLNVELAELEVTLGDKRRIIVDAFGRYKIVDPLRFYQAVGSERGVLMRLQPVVRSSLGSVLGNFSLRQLLSDNKQDVMRKIAQTVNESVHGFGIEMVDVRINKTDLPAANITPMCEQMISEREREARELRANGARQAKIIISETDRDNNIAIAEAEKRAAILIGEANAKANKIRRDAFMKDKEFFDIYRRFSAYRKSMKGGNTRYILSNDADFMKYMR